MRRVGISAVPSRVLRFLPVEAVLTCVSGGAFSGKTNPLIFRRTTSAVGLLRKSILRVSSNSSEIADLTESSNSGNWTKIR